MKFPEFELERWLPTHSATYNLAGSVIQALKFNDILQESDLIPILEMEIKHPPTKGSEALREQISELYETVDTDGVVVTHGAAEGNCIVSHYLLDQGDEILIAVPSYMENWGLARSLGAKVKFYQLNEEEGFAIDLEELKALTSTQTKVIALTNPNNPNGSKCSAEEIRAVCEIAEDVGAYVVCDEAVRGLELDGVTSPSPVDLYENGITVGSISKLGLCGLRMGWVVAEPEIVNRCWTYKDYTTLAGPILSEYVTKIILEKENLEKIMQRNRKLLKEHLDVFHQWIEQNEPYVSCVMPEAGATTFPRYHVEMNSVDFCKQLLAEEDLLLSPGDYFKSSNHVRILYGGVELSSLKIALERLGRFLQRIAH